MQYNNMSYVPALAVALISALYAQSGHADERWTFENKGGLSMETANGNFSFQVIGRIQVDAAFYADDVEDLGSGTELRRARLGVQAPFLSTGDSRANLISLART
jgi:hypothetical protein